MELKDRKEIGNFIKQKFEEKQKEQNKSFSQSDLAQALADFANAGANQKKYTKEHFKDSVSKWINGKCYPGIDSLYYLSRVLKVSIEELLSGGEVNEKYDNRVTLYSMAKTNDEFLMEKFCEQNPEIFLNSDEFDKTLLDYLIKFKNYKSIKYLIDKGKIELYKGRISTDFNIILFPSTNYYREILFILIENNDAEEFNKMYEFFKIINSKNEYRQDLKDFGMFTMTDKEIELILKNDNIYKELIQERQMNAEEFRFYARGLLNEDIKSLKSLSGVFNTLLDFAIKNNLLKQAEEMLKNGIKHNDYVAKVVNEKYHYFIDEDFCLKNRPFSRECFNILAGVDENLISRIQDEKLKNLVIELNNSLLKCGKLLK